MGRIEKGILGGFSGKVGTVIGASWRGMDVMRSRPKKSTKPASELQKEQRAKFALTAKFLAPLAPLTRFWFGQPEGFKSRRNLSLSYHISEAISGVYPNYAIDYANVIITKGILQGVENADVTPQADAELAFGWTDNSGATANEDDLFLAVVYNVNTREFMYRHVAVRTAGSYTMILPENYAADTVQVWVSFISADLKGQASSKYLGAHVIL